MTLRDWDEHYKSAALGRKAAPEKSAVVDLKPSPLLVKTVKALQPGRALDLACGLGKNALYLAALGWEVMAVDGSPEAIAQLDLEAKRRGVIVRTQVANLEAGQFIIETERWDLIVCCLYFQRDLFDPIKHGVKPGGFCVASALTLEKGEESHRFRVQHGELESYLGGWQIMYAGETAGPHRAAEIVARKPGRKS